MVDETLVYSYDDSGDWKDLLLSVTRTKNGVTTSGSLSYDASGNPLTYFNGTNWSFTWRNGRELNSAGGNGYSLNYSYDLNGLRTEKKVTKSGTTETHTYLYASGQLLRESFVRNGKTYTLDFAYDLSGKPYFLLATVDGAISLYYFVTNLQGDVVRITNAQKETLANYSYDAYGKLLSVTNASGTTISGTSNIALINPLRYRGYYYDSETELYYVSSRYYDPEIGRWISPEPNVYNGEFDEGAGLLAYNVYAYCANNPVMFKDETGESITLACMLIGAGIGLIVGAVGGSHYAKHKKNLTPSDGWDYWKYVVGFGVTGAAVGALVGWGAGALIAKYGVATAATSITKGGGARFSSFNALKRSLGSAGKGKQWHHIVEQCQIGKSGFSKYWIQNSNNVINISNSVHSKVSAYYNSVHRFTNGMRFRDWLSGQSFKTQYEWGIKVLRMYGVKI